jgi:hypothetical protein
MSTPATWTVRADRREADLDAIVALLRELDGGVDGLAVRVVDRERFELAPDAGAFRDFIPLAHLVHAHEDALHYVAEVLLEDFGWQVDIVRDSLELP